ncbi:MAG: GspH/FimT family pseudopilin, partial [Lautropia mirabilis]|nr:GspH/FimT family pseudopilin [Lautropia mirabilis]
MKSSQASAGFTLQEMLVVMAIMGIVAAMAAPSFRDFAIQRSIAAQITDLTSALRLARSEALKRGREVSLCPT